MFIKTPDGTIVRGDGKILYFGIDRFIKDICEGDCCFFCGISAEAAEFNQEHVIPDWILARYNLHSKKITLPNGQRYMYGRYKIPCCKKCNSLLGDHFETPISALTASGYEAVSEYLRQPGGAIHIFTWLMLIFLKTHLKDKSRRLHPNPQKGGEAISDLYTWSEFHHLHCVVRSFDTGALLEPGVMGSLLVLVAQTGTAYGDFDFKDLYGPKTMILRLGEVAFVVALADACIALNMMSYIAGKIDSVKGVLSPGQLREVTAHMAFLNLHLRERPQFSSLFQGQEGRYIIQAKVPKMLALGPTQPSDLGSVMYDCCDDIIETIPAEKRAEVTDHMKRGWWSYFPSEQTSASE
jgi:hypothetical protein